MSQMKELLQRAKDLCYWCDEKHCAGCRMTVQHNGNDVLLNGRTKEIIDVQPINSRKEVNHV